MYSYTVNPTWNKSFDRNGRWLSESVTYSKAISSCTRTRPRHRLSSKPKEIQTSQYWPYLKHFRYNLEYHTAHSLKQGAFLSGVLQHCSCSLGTFDLQMLMLETVYRPITPLLHQLPTPPEQSRATSSTGETTSYLSVTQQHWSRLERKLKRGKKSLFILVFIFLLLLFLFNLVKYL